MTGARTEIMTVTGPIRPEALGITLPHEHLLLNFHRVRGNPDGILNDKALAAAEASAFRDQGGRTIVELTNIGLSRDPTGLAAIARETGLNVVMGSGWYRALYYPPEIDHRSADDLADEIVRDLQVGVDGTGIRSGIIGEIGCWDHIG